MEEFERATELAFAESETPNNEFESDFERYIYNEIRTRVLEMRREQLSKEIAMLEKFKAQVKHLMEMAG